MKKEDDFLSRQIKVYWREGCSPCKATKLWLNKKGIEFEAIEVTEEVKIEKGLTQVPYVEVIEYSPSGGSVTDHWTDFRIDKLGGLII